MDPRLDRVAEALRGVGEASVHMAEALGGFCRAYIDYVSEIYDLIDPDMLREAAEIESASPKVRHLAKYGKKARTRKKNTNRAWREYQRRAN